METKKEIATALLMLAGEDVDINLVSITDNNKLRAFFKGRTNSFHSNNLGDSYIGTFILGEDVARIYLISFLGDEISYTYRASNKTLYILNEDVLINKTELEEAIKLKELTLEKAKDILNALQKEKQIVKEKRRASSHLN